MQGVKTSLELYPASEVLVSESTSQPGCPSRKRIGGIKTRIRLSQAFPFKAQIEEFVAKLRLQEGIYGFSAQPTLIAESEKNGTKGMMTDDSPAGAILRFDNPTIGWATWRLMPDPAHMVQRTGRSRAHTAENPVICFIQWLFIAGQQSTRSKGRHDSFSLM
jgi:hypothetical protein